MPNDSFAIRLREARRMRKLSMDKLIELADFVVTKQSLSRYERGVMRPHANVLSALAKALDISEEYFLGTNLNINIPMLRTISGGKLQEDVLTAIEARLSFWTERLIAKEREAGIFEEFKNPIENVQVSSLEDAIQAANLLRQLWHCGDGPIASVLRLLERKGIRIMEDELPADVYGLSTWADHRLPLIVVEPAFQRPQPTVCVSQPLTNSPTFSSPSLPLQTCQKKSVATSSPASSSSPSPHS